MNTICCDGDDDADGVVREREKVKVVFCLILRFQPPFFHNVQYILVTDCDPL